MKYVGDGGRRLLHDRDYEGSVPGKGREIPVTLNILFDRLDEISIGEAVLLG